MASASPPLPAVLAPRRSPGERTALIGAGVAHLLLFAALSIGWQWSQQPLEPAAEMPPVEFVEIAPAPTVTERPEPSIKAAPQETVTAPPPEPDVKPAPDPEPPRDAIPLPDKKPEPAKPEKAAKPPEKARPEPKPLDTSVLTSLIDKALPKAKVKPLDTSSLAKSIAAATPRNATLDLRAKAALAQAIRAQVAPCWNPPIGGADVRRMTVQIAADFNREGRVIGVPSVVAQTGATAGNSDYARAFAETARRAVLRCSPLRLPAELYDSWKSAIIVFDPESMA